MSDAATHAAEEAKVAAEAARAAADLATESIRQLPELVTSAVREALDAAGVKPVAKAVGDIEEGYDHIAEPLTEATE